MKSFEDPLFAEIQRSRNFFALMLFVTLLVEMGTLVWLLSNSYPPMLLVYLVIGLISLIALVCVGYALFRAEMLTRHLQAIYQQVELLKQEKQSLTTQLDNQSKEVMALQAKLAEQSQSSTDQADELKQLRAQVKQVQSLEASLLGLYQKDSGLPLETVFKVFGAVGEQEQHSRKRQQILAVISNLRAKGQLVSESYRDPNKLRRA